MHVLSQSEIIFKLALKVTNEGSLLSFLKKLKMNIQRLGKGEALLLPVYVEGQEIAMLLERTSERSFKVVVIQTDPAALRHHVASPVDSMPEIKYRTCLVLKAVPTKNVLDDVFWMAVYNLKIHCHIGDMAKFYDVLLPFLANEPLEQILLAAETAALEYEQAQLSSQTGDSTEALERHFGSWRCPQRSKTAYVRLFMEAFNYLLCRKGMSAILADQVRNVLFDNRVYLFHQCIFA